MSPRPAEGCRETELAASGIRPATAARPCFPAGLAPRRHHGAACGPGTEVVTTFALGYELQADWKLPSGDAMFEPFTNQLPEYGWVVNNFWNNANQRAVPDPFGTVK